MSKLIQDIVYLPLCKKKVRKHQQINCVQKYAFNKKRSKESSRNVCSADLKDILGKEELYLRKLTFFEV